MNKQTIVVVVALLVLAGSLYSLLTPKRPYYVIDPQTYYPTWGALLGRTAAQLANEPGRITVLVPEPGQYDVAPINTIYEGIRGELRNHQGYDLKQVRIQGVRLIGGVDFPGVPASAKGILDEALRSSVAVISLAGSPDFPLPDDAPPVIALEINQDGMEPLLSQGYIHAAVVPVHVPAAQMDARKGQEQLFKVMTVRDM